LQKKIFVSTKILKKMVDSLIWSFSVLMRLLV